VLDGSKMWITQWDRTRIISLCMRRRAPRRRVEGSPAFVVEKEFEGFSVARKLDKLGMRGSNTGELVFDGCVCAGGECAGADDKGVTVLMEGLDLERTRAECWSDWDYAGMS